MMLLFGGRPRSILHYWCGKYPGRVGCLLGPQHYAAQQNNIPQHCPYALDNDAYGAWVKKQPWDYDAWAKMLRHAKMTGIAPLWVLVPDVVADRDATLTRWAEYSPEARRFGWDLAFAVQDGMAPDDVPANASVVFIGGTTEWKWRSLPMWTGAFPRVHVGRVNELRRLWTCEDLGVESVDGSGWFKKTQDGRQAKQIIQWLENHRDKTIPLPLEPENELRILRQCARKEPHEF